MQWISRARKLSTVRRPGTISRGRNPPLCKPTGHRWLCPMVASDAPTVQRSAKLIIRICHGSWLFRNKILLANHGSFWDWPNRVCSQAEIVAIPLKEESVMSLKPEPIPPVPPATERVAKAAFPKGSTFIRMRDELGTLYTDELFAPFFPADGQPALAP